VSTFDVPKETVGFLLGAKGSTLRAMETKHRVFMFFNNDRMRQGKHGQCKRLYVIGSNRSREDALDEAEDVVRFKLTGVSNGGGPERGDRGDRGGGPPPRDRDYDRGPPPRYDDRYDRGPPPRYDDRRRDDGRGPPPRYDEDRSSRYDDRSSRYDDRAPPRGGYSRYDERPPPPRYDDDRPPRYEERAPPRDDRGGGRSRSRGRH